MRKPNRIMVVAAIVTGISISSAGAETIVLRGGQTIQGSILKQNDEFVFVDMGFTVMEVPRSRIGEIREDSSSETEAAGAEIKTEDLYFTRDLPVAGIEGLSVRFGEAVVMVRSPGGLGSGFIIDERGYVVTNFHVIEGETKITIVIFRKVGDAFQRDKIDKVKIVAVNPFFDLALLKMEPPEGMKFNKVYLDTSESLRDGDTVFAIGNPLGLERTLSQGIVSKRNRTEGGLAYIQTTAQINPGNSGGPLFNNRGQVIGVTNMKITFGEGLGFAIPVRHVIEFLKSREGFAYDSDSPSSGHHYLQPVKRKLFEAPGFLKPAPQDTKKKSDSDTTGNTGT
ncbi:MAG: trypsin-like peptidase domain-containing protein [Planctomycetota bacterium]|nr:trypsin-like peptidase domain-containing protein [Planctomycetota bacterium]